MIKISNPVQLDPWQSIVDCHFGVPVTVSVDFSFWWFGSNPTITACSPNDSLLPWGAWSIFLGGGSGWVLNPGYDTTVTDGYSPAFFGTTYELYPYRSNYYDGDATGSWGLPEGFTGSGWPSYSGAMTVGAYEVFSLNTLDSYVNNTFPGYDERHNRCIADNDAKTITYQYRMPNHRGFLYCSGNVRVRPFDARGLGYDWGDFESWAEVDDLYNYVAFEKTLDLSGFTVTRTEDGAVYEVDTIDVHPDYHPYQGHAGFTCNMKRRP